MTDRVDLRSIEPFWVDQVSASPDPGEPGFLCGGGGGDDEFSRSGGDFAAAGYGGGEEAAAAPGAG